MGGVVWVAESQQKPLVEINSKKLGRNGWKQINEVSGSRLELNI